VTQANAVTSHDGQLSQTDESEDLTPKRHVGIPSASTAAPKPRRPRIRSSSVSLTGAGAVERAEHMGVLKTVQLHARGKHAFAPVESMASAKEKLLADPLPAEPLLVRRNSTAAPLSPLLDAADPPVPPSPLNLDRPITPPLQEHEIVEKFKLAASSGFRGEVGRMSRELLKSDSVPIAHYNAALAALAKVREKGEPLAQVIQFYNAMLDRSVVPNIETYEILINCLTDRDTAVHEAKLTLDIQQKRLALGARLPNKQDTNSAFIEQLNEENNFNSALKLFEGVLAVNGRDGLNPSTFTNLLASAAIHADVNAAIHVFAQLEARTDIRPNHQAYRHLLVTYSKANLPDQAAEIFAEYLAAAKAGRIMDPTNKRMVSRVQQVRIWNAAIEAHFAAGHPEKAIELVEQMMQSTNDNFTAADAPTATPSAFVTVIQGFLNAGDIDSALSWFDKLLVVPHKAPEDPYQGMGGQATRPHKLLWTMMIDALATHKRTDDLVRIFKAFVEKHAIEDSVSLPPISHRVFHVAVLNAASEMEPAKACEALLLVLRDIGTEKFAEPEKSRIVLVNRVCTALARLGVYEEPIGVFYSNVTAMLSKSGTVDSLERKQVKQFVDAVYESAGQGRGQLDFFSVLNLSRIASQLRISPDFKFAPAFLDAYGRSRALIHYDELTEQDWNTLFTYAAKYEANQFSQAPEVVATAPNFNGLKSVLGDLVAQGHGINHLDLDTVQLVISAMNSHYGNASTAQIMAELGPTFVQAFEHYDKIQNAALENSLVPEAETEGEPLSSEAPETYNGGRVTVDKFLSRNITAATSMRPLVDVEQPYKMFEQGLAQGLLPDIPTLSNLIQAVGRAKMLDKVRELYTAAQAVLHTLPVEMHMAEWASVENSMVIALAHAGHPDAAHVHRFRLLEQGFAPSADAYSVLIQLVKDTTDDTTGALNLFKESLDHGIKPNIYLYNNIISKLAKARKADQALELFHQMKGLRLRPSSITYGAIIAACARVGDAPSAEALFKEMSRMEGFKPRVPPYNTMMQLYAHTKPMRRNVLYYYEEMLKAKIQPTAHTYKVRCYLRRSSISCNSNSFFWLQLLMDAYGTIEPIQLDKMEETFAELQANPSAELTGAHFASLINAYGCAAKDMEKAVSIFEDLLSGQYPGAPKPDAVVFEAIINVVVAHKRTELIPVYISKMTEAGVHMTAYVANFLIKGYALAGDIDQARSIFESLSDPPAGVAAPNNHAPHSPDLSSESEVSVMEPVYREVCFAE
jgi:pentatricopeptide repeat protein